jgi:hypothetical protein
MPGSIIAEMIVQPILEAVFEVGLYYVGRVVVPVVSLGRWKCDPLLRETPKKKQKWGGVYHLRGDQVYFTNGGTSVVGLVSVAVVICGILWWKYG